MPLTAERLARAHSTAQAWADAPAAESLGRLFLDVIEAYDELNGAITWDTTCLNCASLLDSSYESFCKMEDAVNRLQVADRQIDNAVRELNDYISDELSMQEIGFRERIVSILWRTKW